MTAEQWQVMDTERHSSADSAVVIAAEANCHSPSLDNADGSPLAQQGTPLAVSHWMPSVRQIAIVLPLLFSRLAAADDPDCRLSGQVADVERGGAVESARVVVSDRSGVRATTQSNRLGHYTVVVPPGDYEVSFVYGTSRTSSHVRVTASCTATLDGKVDVTGEVIVIQDQKPPKVPARPTNYKASANPPYSDAALEKDAWTRTWLLLDVSVSGEVTQFKFLKRPGFDLEDITASEVWKLKFEPARDDHDQPMRIWMLWGLEWPSNGWLMKMNLPRTMKPPVIGFQGRRASDTVPCKGSGPMHLGSVYPTYRDCSTPDLSRMAQEPWIVRP
jgi:hypothetical protein